MRITPLAATHKRAGQHRIVVKFAAVAALASSLIAATPASAATLEWKEEWPRFRTSEWIVTAGAGATVLVLYVVPPIKPTWGHPILFDSAVRDGLRPDTDAARDRWARVSDVGYWGMAAYPILVDSIVVPLARGSSTVAAQTTLINLEAFAITGAIFRITEATVRRARPLIWDCKERTGSYDSCHEDQFGATSSFIAGHVAIAATGAALMCTHHAYLHLYGGLWDAIACGLGVAVSGGVAVGRLAADKHWATDTVAGLIVGGLSGWLTPTLLHYGFDGRGTAAGAALKYAPRPMVTTNAIGLSWSAVL